MVRQTTFEILTAKGTEELAVSRPGRKPVILVGIVRRHGSDALLEAAKRERREVARTYIELGCEVYESHHDPEARPCPRNRPQNDWPNDLFLQVDHTILPANDVFHVLGEGGNYVLGEDFVLVSKAIESAFRAMRGKHAAFRRTFANRSVYFVEPYVMKLRRSSKGTAPWRVKTIPLRHLDLTIGYVPRQRVLTVADAHYARIASQVEAIAKRHRLRLETTASDPPLNYHPFVNNYFVINPGCRDQVVVANAYDGFAQKLRTLGVNVRCPRILITRLAVWRGSIKCISNQAPSTAVFDRLGISYRRWKPVERAP